MATVDAHLDHDPGNRPSLPVRLSHFIGRERELAELGQLLVRARVVTLVGAPGVGKTRLACEWGHRTGASDPDRIWFVDLAPLEDPALLPQMIVDRLGLLEQRGRAPSDVLVDYLRMIRVLLILDNCEHVVTACASLVDHLVRAAPGVRILATSREPLSIEGETVWRVPSLSSPATDRPLSPDALLQFESARLFADRATAVRPGFVITATNTAAIARICHGLDGIPLALELAAARLSVLSTAQIAVRLDDSLGLLVGGYRASVPRRQTLRAAIDWSYALLAEAERGLLDRLSVFSGDWTLEAAEAVCAVGGTDASDFLDLLSGLLDKSLLELVEHGEVMRYRLLEPIRQYGRERLRDHGEEDLLARRHAEWLLALVEEVEPDLYGPEQAISLARLDAEQNNVRAALTWCRANAPPASDDIGLRLVGGLCRYWSVRDRVAEGRGWQEAVLAGTPDRPSQPLARVLFWAAYFAWVRNDWVRAEDLAGRALAMANDVGDLPTVGHALVTLAVSAAVRKREIKPATIEEAVDLFRGLGDEYGIWRGLENLAELQRFRGQLALAVGTHERALEVARRRQDDWAIGWSLGDLARAAREAGDGERALRLLEETLVIWKHLGAVRGVNWVLVERARLALGADQLVQASTLLEHGLTLSRDSGDRAGISDFLEGVGHLLALTGRTDRAARFYGAAEALREAVRMPRSGSEHRAREASVNALRDAMTDVAFATAWAAGRGLPLATAVEEALDTAHQVQLNLAARTKEVPPTEPPVPAHGDIHLRPDRLTPREIETAVLVARGLTNRQIATELVITERTAAAHVGHILEKLGLASRTQIAIWTTEQGLVTKPSIY
jgi:predicted ATPase/DNA-binding CsgD family transcriptional regulator